jgi:hypothetical protein
MSKQQLIEAIREMNRSADETFLVHFNQPALEDYLRRLSMAQAGRGRMSRWVRAGHTPSVTTTKAQ